MKENLARLDGVKRVDHLGRLDFRVTIDAAKVVKPESIVAGLPRDVRAERLEIDITGDIVDATFKAPSGLTFDVKGGLPGPGQRLRGAIDLAKPSTLTVDPVGDFTYVLWLNDTMP